LTDLSIDHGLPLRLAPRKFRARTVVAIGALRADLT